MPQQSSITDEQYRAAGWSEDKIADLRRQEANEYTEIIASQEAANKQAQYTAQVHQSKPAASPAIDLVNLPAEVAHFCTLCQGKIKQTKMMHTCGGCGKPSHISCAERIPTCPQCGTPVQPTPAPNEAQYQQPAEPDNLSSAFGSLGVAAETPVEEPEPELPDTASALDTFAPEASHDEIETASVEIENATPSEPQNGQNLPQVNCGFCDRKLTHTDQWIECPDCGIYSHAQCRQGQQVCSRCGSKN
jgi:hypothetical protein